MYSSWLSTVCILSMLLSRTILSHLRLISNRRIFLSFLLYIRNAGHNSVHPFILHGWACELQWVPQNCFLKPAVVVYAQIPYLAWGTKQMNSNRSEQWEFACRDIDRQGNTLYWSSHSSCDLKGVEWSSVNPLSCEPTRDPICNTQSSISGGGSILHVKELVGNVHTASSRRGTASMRSIHNNEAQRGRGIKPSTLTLDANANDRLDSN